MDKSRENIGWKSMADILDREMPKDSKRQILPWLILFLVSSTLAGFWGYNIGKSNKTNQLPSFEFPAESPNLAENVINQKATDHSKQKVDNSTQFINKEEDVYGNKHYSSTNQVSNLIYNTNNYSFKYTQKEADNDLNGEEFTLEFNTDQNLKIKLQPLDYVETQILGYHFEETLVDHEIGEHVDIACKNDIGLTPIEQPIIKMDETLEKESINSTKNILPVAASKKNVSFWMAASWSQQLKYIFNSSILVSFGVDKPIGTNFEVYGLVGSSYRHSIETNGQALLSRSYLDASAAGTNTFSLKDKHNVAEITYRHAFSGIAGAGLRYNLNARWSIFGGIDYQYLFGVVKDPIIHSATYADGTPNSEVLYPEEILSNYKLVYNHNMLCQTGLSWGLTQNLKIEGIFTYGVKPLIRHSLSNLDGREQMLGIQLRYIW
jgi:hypothetical protein